MICPLLTMRKRTVVLTQAFDVLLSENYCLKTEQMQNHPLATDECKDIFYMRNLKSYWAIRAPYKHMGQ